MSLSYRKMVRDAVLSILQAKFNTQVNVLAIPYGLTPFTIDFSSSSASFAVSRISDQNIEVCQLTDFNPIAGCLYTEEAMDTGDPHGFRFAGQVELCIHWWIRSRAGLEPFDTESILDMAEDATLSILNDPANQWPAGVIFNRQTEMGRDGIYPLSDGWGQRIAIRTRFSVCI